MDRRQFPQLPPSLRAWPDAALVFELNEILLRAGATAVGERYQSSEEMRTDLALLQAGKSVKHRRAWRRSFSHAKKAVLAVASLAIASAIIFSLPIWKSGPPAVEWSKNEAANDAFRNGSLFMDTGSGEALPQAAKFFERAIALDPKFARAYAGLANASCWADPGGAEILEKARFMAEKAVALDEKLDDAHRALGWPKAVLERDWSGAEKEYRRALQLNPSSGKNLYGLANILVLQGRTNEAVQLVEKALRMDSLSILSLQNAGWAFSAARQYERAIQKFEEVLEKEPSGLKRMADLLAFALRERGDYLKAIQVEEESALLNRENPDQVKTKYDALREAWRRGGAKAYWQQVLDGNKNDESNPVLLAALYARVGEREKAFHYLNLAFARTPTRLTFAINREPAFDGLRSEPRFAGVLKKLNLGK